MPAYDVAILGAGAAGLMCAIAAGRRGRRVVVLDQRPEPGAKILISGGGRCNFTNTGTSPDRFFSDNKHFCRSALNRYTPQDFIALVDKHTIPYHEKTLGQLFCDGSARAIVAMLLAECAEAGVQLELGQSISAINHATSFHIRTQSTLFTAESLVLATGGLSIPKLGASPLAYDTARQFGLRITPLRPALVPFTFDGDLLDTMRPLSGVSLPAEATHGPNRFREAILFTHRGLSGPAILQISSCWQTGPITLNLLPGQDAAATLLDRKHTRPRAELHTILAELLPNRLAPIFAPPGLRLADQPDRTLRTLAARLSAWHIAPTGTEGYAKAEVTIGGIDTRDLSSQTLEATTQPGLFAIGEAVDVTGWLGGYNFQWAWASGWAAGQAA